MRRSLEEDAARVTSQIEEQIDNSTEIQQVVELLEQQYDENLEQYRSDHPHAAIPGESQDLVVPTSEELGEEFERFLKQLDGTDNDSDL